jgi:glycosyltransferase involved in cell wall biosynthesis
MASRILLIAYLFPPAGGVGVLRVLSFAKYLPQSGHQVHVLSARNPTTPTLDPDLLKQVPPEVTIHRAVTPELPFHFRQTLWKLVSPPRAQRQGSAPNTAAEQAAGETGLKSMAGRLVRRFFSPDPEVVWTPFAIRRASRIIVRNQIDTVIVTVPPFSSLLIGTALKRSFPGIKLISDFRDEWFQFHLSVFAFHNNSYTIRRAREIETDAVRSSDLVLSVVPSIIDQMRERHPVERREKFQVISNGFDPALVEGFRSRPHGTQKVIVTFVGTIYGPSTLRYYLDALTCLPEEVRSRFETRIVGRIADEERSTIENAPVKIDLLGFKPQTEAFRLMEETDFLLLTMTDPSCITGKFFDYIGTGKPMLAFTPEGGEVQRMLAETGAGWWADYRERDAISRLLLRAHDAALAGTVPEIPRAVAERFGRPKLAAELSGLIEDLRADRLVCGR